MKYFEICKKALVLTFILFTLINLPLITFSYNINASNKLENSISLNYDDLALLTSKGRNLDYGDSNFKLIEEETIFDSSLKDYLLNYSSSSNNAEDEIDVIILFNDELSKSNRINIIQNNFEDYEVIRNYDIITGVHLVCSSGELLTKKQILNDVEGMVKIYKSEYYQMPSYPEIPNLNSLDSNDYSNWWIPAVGAESLIYDGSGIRVAIVDTGIYEHPDLNIVANRSFVTGDLGDSNDDYGHGTHAAGIIGGSGVSSAGEYIGIAPGVSLINARAGDFEGLRDVDIIDAIEWCVQNSSEGGADADIISMSFGGGLPIDNDPLNLAISEAANDYGVLLVSSAGNSGPDYFTGGSPASGTDIISVGATDINNNLASFTSWGPTFTYLGYPDVVAPGVNVIAAESPGSYLSDQKRFIGDFFDFPGNGDYIPLSGTSMSCPVVAGALAILLDAYPSLTPEAARIALLEGAEPLSAYDADDTLKFGAGLINVSASLDFLDSLSSDVNDTAIFFPDIIPLQPYDLLNFPGDKQSFNITVISGKANNYNINIPNKVDGLNLNLDNNAPSFIEEDVQFITLDIEIEQNATPGIRNFEMNITIGAIVYDSIEITIEVKFPEYKVLMESFHGLNDWFPEISFYQMDFYEFMKDMSNLNISFDYAAEYWTPYYDADNNNSLLTEERLAQYDLIILQNPILPYTQEEMENIKNYFDGGGNILFLGTRYQDLCVDNINVLFSTLDSDISINQENIYSENWLGIGASINRQSVTDLDSSSIFANVDKFEWYYGNTFDVGINSNSVATLNSKTVAATYNKTSHGGKLVAFGDLNWMGEYYTSANYIFDHATLAQNLMDYFFSKDEVSIQIVLESERTSNPQFNLSIYLKELSSGLPIDSSTLNNNLSVLITNSGFSESITMSSVESGIAQNTTYSLSSPDYTPYVISVNFTYNSNTYQKSSKLLYFNPSLVPTINSLTVSNSPLDRAPGNFTQLRADLDSSSYNIKAYLSLYSYSFYNTKQTINKTFSLSYNIPFSRYQYNYDPLNTDPAGVAVYFIFPENSASNYTNPYSPRFPFGLRNNNPEFIESTSFINIGGQNTIAFDETYEGESSYLIPVSQGDELSFTVTSTDSVSYEDVDSSNMRVSVNLFMVSTTEEGFINLIIPRALPVSELTYQPSTDSHQGLFTIPFTISYNSIAGLRSVSTATTYSTETEEGYLAILLITLIDSEGGTEDFIIILSIEASFQFDLLFILIIVGLLVVLGAIVFIALVFKSRRTKDKVASPEYYPQDYYATPTEYDSSSSESEGFRTGYYCPYCGYNIGSPKSFCPNCGKSLYFETQ